MRRFVLLMLALVVLLSAAPAAAQLVYSTQLFPVVARGEGANDTLWVTDLAITNPMPETVTVGVQFFPANQDNLFNPLFPDRITLAPYETVMVEDVLLNMFGIDEAAMGQLVLISDPMFIPGNPENAGVLPVTRTYNVGSPEGTFGQTVPSNVLLVNVGWASTFITGVRNDADFRSNLGIASSSPISRVRVFYKIRDAGDNVLAEGSKTISVASMGQWSLASLGVGTVDGPISIELWLDPENMSAAPCEEDIPNGFFGYVSKVDNGTGDAEYLFGAPIIPYICTATAPE
jgi:hypothetical protein